MSAAANPAYQISQSHTAYLYLVITKLSLSLLFTLFLCTGVRAHLPQEGVQLNPPANDDLINATVLSGSSTFANIAATDGPNTATTEGEEVACEITTSIWYAYTAPATAQFRVFTGQGGPDRPESNNDITLGIFTGSVHPLTQIDCLDDPSTSGDELTTLGFVGGTTYYIRIGFRPNAQIDDLFLSIRQEAEDWTGAVGNDWFEPGNWSSGQVPGAAAVVNIPATGTNPVISTGNVSLGEVEIQNGGALTIASEASLIIAGDTDGISVRSGGQMTIDGMLNVVLSNNGTGIAIRGEMTVNDGGQLVTENGVQVFGTLTVAGNLTATNVESTGCIAVASAEGGLEIPASGSVVLTGSSTFGLSCNTGTISVAGSLSVLGSGGTGIGISDTGAFIVEPGGFVLSSGAPFFGLDMGGASASATNNGTLVLTDNDQAALRAASSSFTNAAGATLRAVGEINVENAAYVAGSRLEPGSSPGCVSFTAATDLSTTTLGFEIDGPLACDGYDQITFTSDLNITDATLELSGSYVPFRRETFTLLTASGGAARSGTFAGLAEGAMLNFNGTTLEVSYQGGAGNDVVLTTIQAPRPVWTGAVDSDWSTPENWVDNRLPVRGDTVLVPTGVANQPVLGSGEVLIDAMEVDFGNDLTVDEGAKLTLEAGDLTFSGNTLTIAGELVVEDESFPSGGVSIREGELDIPATGVLRIDSAGINTFLGVIMRVSGRLDILNSTGSGVALNTTTSSFLVESGGVVNIIESAQTGLTMGGPVQIDGALTISDSGADGIILTFGQEGFTIGQSGSVSVTGSGAGGIVRTGIIGQLINNGELVLTDNFGGASNFNTIETGPGATLRSDGSLLNAGATFATGSNLFPGSSPGCLTFFGDADLSGANITYDLGGQTVCEDYDQLVLKSTADLTDAVLILSGAYIPADGDVFMLIDKEDANPITGTFAGLAEGATVMFNGVELTVSYSGGDGNDVVLTAESVLPLDLLSFTGEALDKTNLLTWTTANEEDFSHFAVERSADGQGPWSVLAEPDLQASGEHEYIDETPPPTAYYRLKLIDLDGTFSYSEVFYLENFSGGDAGAMKVYPNPSSGRFTVDLSEAGLPAAGGEELRLVDLRGRVVMAQELVPDYRTTTIEFLMVKAGVYVLTLITKDGQTLTRRVVVN